MGPAYNLLTRGWELFSSLCPDQLWGAPILLSSGCWELIPWG